MSLEPAVDAESHNVSASSEDWSPGVDLDTSQGHHNEADFTALPNHQSALVTYSPQSQQTVNTSADKGTSFIDNIGRTSLDCSLVDHPETVQEEAVSPVIHVPLVSGGLSEATLRNYCQAVNSSASIQDPLNSSAESPLAQSPQIVKSPVNPQLVYTLQTVNSPVRVCTPQTATPRVALQTVNSPVRPAVFHRPLTVISPVKCAVVRPQQNINSPLRSVLVCTPKTVNSPVRSPVFRAPQNINSPVRSSLVRSPQTINSPVRGTLVRTQQPLSSPVRSTLFSAPETPKTATVGTSQIISSTATGGTKTVVVTSPAKSSKISPEVIKSLSKTFCDGDLQTWMIYNIRSNHHNAPNGHTLALWNGTEFVEVPQAEKYINELNQNTPQICNTNGGIHIAAAEPKNKSIQIQQTPSASLGKRSASTLSVLKQLKTPSSPYPSVRLTSPTTQKQNGAVSNSNLVNTNSPVRPARGKNKQVQQTLVKGNRLTCPTVITKVVRNSADVLGVNSNSVTKAPGVTRIYVQSVPKSDGTCKPGTVTGNTPVIRNIPVQKQIIIQKSTPEPKPGVQQQTPEHKSVLPRHIPVERTVISVVPDTTSVQEQVPVPEPAQPEPEEKLAEDEFKVCKNCGNLSKNPRICEGCGKPCGKDRTFKKNLGQQMLFKSVPSVDKAPTNPEVLTKQSFYGKKLEEQSKPYNQTFGVTKRSLRDIVRKRKPINSKRKAEPETVIISSDEEETNCDTPISATEESPTKGANSVHSEPSVTSTDCSSSNFTPSVASRNESTGIDSHRSTVGRVCNSSVAQLAGNQDNKVADTSQLSGSTTTTPDRKHSTQGLALSNPGLTASISRERRPNQETVQHTFPTLHQERMGTRRDRMEDADGNIPRKSRRQTRKTKVAADAEQQPFDKDKGTSVAMNVRCVRFGLLRGVPVEPVFFSREGIFIKMECEDKSQEVHIPPAEMENLAVHLNPRLPVMFINPSFNCGQRLHREIGCTQEQFAPGSEDLKTKFITLLFDHGTTEEERNFLDSLFMHYERIKPHQPKFLQILNHEEANNVLVQTSETRFPYQDSTLNTSASEENPAFDLGPHVAVEKLFIYRTPPEKGGITITTEDLYCLTEGEFLNDVIIDFYLKYLKAEVLSDEANERLYVFSSFFYKGLTQKLVRATGDKQVDLKVRRHENVKTWTRRVDLFSKDFIVIPINEHAHWFLAIICFPGMVPEKAGSTSNHNGKASSQEEAMDQSFDSNSMSTGETEEPEQPPSHNKPCHKQPCILVFDSLAGPARTSIVKTLRDYLSVEWSVKKQTERQFDRVTMKGGYPKVPQQNNCSDCGIYLLQYVESFFESPIEDFSLPIKGLQNWFTDERVGRKRVEIRDLILSMREKYAIEQTKSAS